VSPAVTIAPSLRTLLAPGMRGRLAIGCLVLIVINTLIYGFITWLPTFFVKQGMDITQSFGFAFAMSLGAPAGTALGAFAADHLGRRPVIIGASLLAIGFGAIYPFAHQAVVVVGVGLALVIPIYVLAASLFGIYVPELFPTEVRLRGTGICNMFGRAATIATPYVVVWLYAARGVTGVLTLMIGLLTLQIVAVASWGIETRGRALEDVGRPTGGVA
jgi:putative MFS transporter